MTFLEALLLAIVEGLTEFLPVSSTGHMILTASLLHLQEDEFVKTFEVFIQLGAILAILMMYLQRFLQGIEIYLKLAVAFIPTAIVGFLAYEVIKEYLFSPLVVAISLIIGGVVLILVDRDVTARSSKVESFEKLPYRNAFFIGFIQCLAMIPGVSRAGATIVGGVYNGFNKKEATEFSFLLAVPTMFAASGYDLLKSPVDFTQQQFLILGMGLIAAFISAWLAVKIFLKLVENYGFKHFGYYRIIIGAVFLLYFYW